ncbi:Tyrosinase [Dactylellina cionopaga]|nr:Tyrosinase [Dactylellina cionopaga]
MISSTILSNCVYILSLNALVSSVYAAPTHDDAGLNAAANLLHKRQSQVLYKGACKTAGDRVRIDDTCDTAATRNGISVDDILKYNALLEDDCDTINDFTGAAKTKAKAKAPVVEEEEETDDTENTDNTDDTEETDDTAETDDTEETDDTNEETDDTEEEPDTPAERSYALVGAGGGCIERQNIETMRTDQPDVFNLLILALQRMETADTSDPYSFYQIAGIHGGVSTPWPNKEEQGDFEFNPNYGYCPHGSTLFSSWHRPFILTLEQAVYTIAGEVAAEFTGAAKKKYVAAAKTLRFPYWDWADETNQSYLPAIVAEPEVDVVTPKGKQTIKNPFYAYRFKGTENKAIKAKFIGAKQTVRGVLKVATSNEALVDQTLQSDYKTRRKGLYNILMSEISFNDFNKKIEGFHNEVHTAISGFMYYIPLAAWDPVFWLHHNNIDRLLAIWQAANPTMRLKPTSDKAVAPYQRIIAGDDVDMNTALLPFKHDDGTWWIPNDVADVRSIWKYNYGYPELPCSRQSNTAAQLDKFATSQVNRLYKKTVAPKRKVKRSAETKVIEWNINIVIDQSELPGSFEIMAFLGTPSKDPSKWSMCKTKVGTLSVFGVPGVPMPPKIMEVVIPLTPILTDKKMCPTTTPETKIDAFLDKNLTWRCLSEGKEIDIKTLKSLKVGVTNNPVTFPASDEEKPKFGKPKLRVNATNKKQGGVTKEEDLTNPQLKDATPAPEPEAPSDGGYGGY